MEEVCVKSIGLNEIFYTQTGRRKIIFVGIELFHYFSNILIVMNFQNQLLRVVEWSRQMLQLINEFSSVDTPVEQNQIKFIFDDIERCGYAYIFKVLVLSSL